MSWGYRLSVPEGARAEGIEDVLPYHGRVCISGKRIPYLERKQGKSRWGIARYGLHLYNTGAAKLFWNAKRESLKLNEKWSSLIRKRIVIPVDAYVESSPTRCWMVGERGWVPGLIDTSHNGGVVTITETISKIPGAGGSPIILDQNAAMTWLNAQQWEAIPALDGARIRFTEADVFVSARLDAESKNNRPIAA